MNLAVFKPPTFHPKVEGVSFTPTVSNLVDYTYDADQWTNSWSGGVTREYPTSDTVAPDGSLTAAKLSRIDNASDSIYLGSQTLLTLTVLTEYTVSIYVKGGTATTSRVDVYDDTAAAYLMTTEISWSAGVASIGTTDADSTGVIEVGNGWYRVHAVFTTHATNISYRPLFIPDRTANGANMYTWGAQLTQAPNITKHILTNG